MDQFIGEIRMFAGTFAPVGWELCWGQLLPISQYDVLFQLIGTTYGGDGVSNFALPDLRGRIPIHVSSGLTLGAQTGTETVTLNNTQMPSHTHALRASTQLAPQGGTVSSSSVLAQTDGSNLYASTGRRSATLAPSSVQVSGGNQPHDNMSPYLCVNFIISTQGVFPSQN
ncbi:phage tail protein [Deinococcus radiotolerans]|uniref:Tail Collar domain-containing protein n=1 Tax=Deinococcus radiotolerans TaxID=1309407 RepID=A0ABQ2FRN9_9DEIO|nr:tail fiber protein [Deinococcus radiotolerans]GGL19778.1 tail Collar domain-containing protein [Deinococcus radiotolerans]